MTEEDSVVEWKAGSMQKIEVVGTVLRMYILSFPSWCVILVWGREKMGRAGMW